MKYRKIMVPVELPGSYKFRAVNSLTGEVLESSDLASLFRHIAENLDAYYWHSENHWTLDTFRVIG